ncbi:MAG: hypothetical protein AAFY15_13215, partial [Cyanobacteria bacterium J06648_11]
GAVAIEAAGASVLIEPDFYSLVQPGEPPLPPQSLAETDLNLTPIGLEPIAGIGTTTSSVRLVAQVHPINIAVANGIPISVDLDGRLDAVIPLAPNRRLTLTLRSPLGDERTYELSVPPDGWEALAAEEGR